MKLFLLFFFIALTWANRIEIPLPVGPISNNSIYGPLNYNITNMKLSFVDPGIGLNNVTWYRVFKKVPSDFPQNLLPSLNYHLKAASNPTEFLIITGISKCGPEVRLVTLTDNSSNSNELPDNNSDQVSKCCSLILNGHYGTTSCTYHKDRIIYLVTHGSNQIDWISGAEGQFDSPLDLRGIRQAEDIAKSLKNIDLVISSGQDAASLTGEIIALKAGVELWIDEVLSKRCGLCYESWRLFRRIPKTQSSKSLFDLLGGLSSDFFRIVLVMDSCMADKFLTSIGYANELKPNSILKINLQNSTGILYWNFHLLSSGLVHSIKECNFHCETSFNLDLKVLDGSEIDYNIPKTDLHKLNPVEQTKYIRFHFEREIWSNLYWNRRDLIKEGILEEKHGVRYWGRFIVSKITSEELLGIYWIELIKSIWFP